MEHTVKRHADRDGQCRPPPPAPPQKWPKPLKSERNQHMPRSYVSVLLAGSIGLISVTQAIGQQTCRPALAFKEVRFSPMQPPTMERKWTAVVSVDASRCATVSGRFGIVFSRLAENGPDIDFQEQFKWQRGEVAVSVDFWADEAVKGYRLNDVEPCPCRD
jgi:hypothetical protein